MNEQDRKRLIKIEDKLYQYATEFGLKFCGIEWDIVPDQKMFEIMAYRIPGNISSWKYVLFKTKGHKEANTFKLGLCYTPNVERLRPVS